MYIISMMKTFCFLVLLFLTVTGIDARQGGPFGLGVVLGDPTGLSIKYWKSKDRAVTGALAFDTYHRNRDLEDNVDLYIHGAYLWHNLNAIPVDVGVLPIYWGLGGRLLAGDPFALGVRGCGGFEYLPRAPIDIFFELGLVVDFIGHTGADLDAGVGIRYFF